MYKEINLQIPDSLYSSLAERAKGQGVSVETLCLSLLESNRVPVDPVLYSSMSNIELREEIRKVLNSNLPEFEMKKRVRTLEAQITRFIRCR